MGTAGRSAPLRRTGSLLGLLGLELAVVLALHWLGRFAGLRIRWDEPIPWLLSSPLQEVLGAVLRTVALVMAYWLLASTVAYLLASLTGLSSAVRAVGWATLPLVRRVADHAVAVTLATSMVGGTTLGVAGPALAAEDRELGQPARKPVAAAQATGSGAQDPPPSSAPGPSSPAYVPDPADHAPTSAPEPTQAPEPAQASEPAYVPDPAGQPTTTSTSRPPTTTTATTTAPTTTTATTRPPTTTAGPTTTAAPTTATPTTAAPTTTTATTRPPTTTAAPTTAPPATTAAPTTATPSTAAAPTTGPPATAPPTTVATGPTRQGSAAAPPASTNAYVPKPASDVPGSGLANPGTTTTTTNPATGPSTPDDPSSGGSDGGKQDGGRDQDEQAYRVAGGDNLWTIARDHLSRRRSGGSGQPTNREVAGYWVRLVEANRDGLRSGDPDLIYPGEEITLPPVD